MAVILAKRVDLTKRTARPAPEGSAKLRHNRLTDLAAYLAR